MRRNLLSITLVCLVVFIDAKLDVVDVSIKNQPGNLISTNVRASGRAPKLISGNVTYLKDLSNEERVSVDVKKTSGLVLDFPGFINMNICDAIKKFFDPYIKTTFKTGENTNLDFKNGKLCPIPKGTYWMKNIALDVNKWKLPWWLLPGSYSVNVSVLNKDGSPGGSIAFRAKLKNK
ncbi:uncharacterized protein LOC119550850 isoform X2 [Drosophila subpulchrella]|nr:uncharacterized protein LOC119550850 isoform X2 [Drosophila subpulchrella]